MGSEQKKSTKLYFRTKARMIKILGEHLIRDNTVGLMELIKNSYDADATLVTVHVLDTKNPEKSTVIVEDDGEGMTEEVIRGPWFEPAHGGKERAKQERKKTKRGRLPLGEKGVGRFATQKLGKKLELITRPEGGKYEFYITIDWEYFEDTDKYMDEIEFDLLRREPKIFTGKQHGTKLIIKEIGAPWRRKELKKLQANLIKLLAPSKIVQDFKIIFKCPEFPEIENLEMSDIIEKFQFKIECMIDHKGYANYTYYHRSPDGKTRKITEKVNLWANVNPDDWTSTVPSCGPFKVTIAAWLRVGKTMEEYGISKEQLKILGGVSIYRDGLRVLPYGDEGHDWLLLDPRRIDAPGERYDNSQVIGIVEIGQVDNPRLIDKTNREGLQENQSYFDLQDLTLGVVSLLERASFEQRQKEKPQITRKKDLESKIAEQAQQIGSLSDEIKKIKESAVSAVSAGKDSEMVSKRAEEGLVQVPVSQLNRLEDQALKIRDDAAVIEKEVKSFVDELSQMGEEKIEPFLHLLGIGLFAERFAHEFDNLVFLISQDINKISGGNYDAIRHLDMCVNALRNEIALMGICRYIRMGQKSSRISIAKTMGTVLKAYEGEFHDADIKVEFAEHGEDDFQVFMPEASLAQVFNNIISNAVYWLKQKSEIDKRKLYIKLNSNENSIIIANSGPKILPQMKKHIFTQPFVTAKPDGRGLGMYISAEILKRNDAEIKTLEDSDLKNFHGGAGFQIFFHQKSRNHSSI